VLRLLLLVAVVLLAVVAGSFGAVLAVIAKPRVWNKPATLVVAMVTHMPTKSAG
jgi:hypothetical protein